MKLKIYQATRIQAETGPQPSDIQRKMAIRTTQGPRLEGGWAKTQIKTAALAPLGLVGASWTSSLG